MVSLREKQRFSHCGYRGEKRHGRTGVLRRSYPEATRFPEYYDGKLVIYDWMRNWLMAVTLDSAGNFYRLEPFADSVRMSRPMDMFFSKNGTLWLIEYGTRWYSANEDARLSRIDYVRGNRKPRAGLKASRTEAGVPATIAFDFDGTMAPRRRTGYLRTGLWRWRKECLQIYPKNTR